MKPRDVHEREQDEPDDLACRQRPGKVFPCNSSQAQHGQRGQQDIQSRSWWFGIAAKRGQQERPHSQGQHQNQHHIENALADWTGLENGSPQSPRRTHGAANDDEPRQSSEKRADGIPGSQVRKRHAKSTRD